jgi:DNA invertase Pin-like site-specific DNA recombinase
MRFAYARVSAEDQNLATQLDDLTRAGYDELFQEKITGASTSRPALDAMLAKLRPGDTVIVGRFFRLGRNSAHLIELIDKFRQEGIQFIALDLQIDSNTPAGKLVLTVFAGLAQYQREDLLEKTAHGRRLAAERGQHMGRRPGRDAEAIKKVQKGLEKGMSNSEIVDLTGISLSSVKRYRREIAAAAAQKSPSS